MTMHAAFVLASLAVAWSFGCGGAPGGSSADTGAGSGGDCGTCPPETVCDGSRCVHDPCPAGFVLVPSGGFDMGSPASEPGRAPAGGDETLHHVALSRPFCLQVHEVTQSEWKAVMGTNPAYFSSCGDDCPVLTVSWHDAVAYCNTLSDREGLTRCYEVSGAHGTAGGGCPEGQVECFGDFAHDSVAFLGPCAGYRLPTEAEWEFAARAGTSAATYGGTVDASHLGCEGPDTVLDPLAWFCGNDKAAYEGAYDCSAWSVQGTCGPQPVKGKLPNAWGLYDMLGNVFELCWDWYGPYPAGTALDPVGPATGASRVIRGGAWDSSTRFVRAALRDGTDPVDRGNAGLRLARWPGGTP